MMSEDNLALKLSAARTRLIIDKPFLGALVLRLPLVVANADWCHTTATDAKSIFYNPDYISQLNIAQTQFILAHEALHCALSHFARRQHRHKHRWDIACDFAINPMLCDDGLEPPPGALLEESYHGMTAEEIYPTIHENSEQAILDKHIYDSDSDSGSDSRQQNLDITGKRSTAATEKGDTAENKEALPDSPPNSGKKNNPTETPAASNQDTTVTAIEGEVTQPTSATDSDSDSDSENDNDKNSDKKDGRGADQPQPLSEQEREDLKVQWQQRLAGAAQQAMQAGKMGAAMQRLIDHLLQPQLPWRSLLAHYISNIARDDYSYSRPNSRRGGPAIFPSLRSEEVDIVVVLDTSGSIAESETQEFLSEVNAIKSQLRARIVFHTCDASLSEEGPWFYEAWENFSLPEYLPGGGATDFRPVFTWVDSLDRAPQLLVYFTDADGDFPATEPHYPVIWLVKGRCRIPWGQRVQLN
ncbi:MAG: VWA-like domain-containing protein [Thiohalomonadales bacterium]